MGQPNPWTTLAPRTPRAGSVVYSTLQSFDFSSAFLAVAPVDAAVRAKCSRLSPHAPLKLVGHHNSQCTLFTSRFDGRDRVAGSDQAAEAGRGGSTL